MIAAVKDAPETPGQAAGWERVKGHAERYGFCPPCAAQIAWGHQLGFGRTTRPPCEVCGPLVAALPEVRPGGWRTVSGSASRAQSWRTA